VSALAAHRLDEYLQAARIDLQAEGVRVEIDLTPGAMCAGSIVALIDHDGDGSASQVEQHTYALGVVDALDIAIDGSSVRLWLEAATFPGLPALGGGDGTIRLVAIARIPKQPPGRHTLEFSNRHLPVGSVYLANALVPRDGGITVSGQRRTGNQNRLTIDYSVGALPARRWGWPLLGLSSAALLLGLARRRGLFERLQTLSPR
jgi:hypothetical protein